MSLFVDGLGLNKTQLFQFPALSFPKRAKSDHNWGDLFLFKNWFISGYFSMDLTKKVKKNHVVLNFESVNKILCCDHSNETFSAVLLHGTICFSIFYKMKFGFS